MRQWAQLVMPQSASITTWTPSSALTERRGLSGGSGLLIPSGRCGRVMRSARFTGLSVRILRHYDELGPRPRPQAGPVVAGLPLAIR